MTHRTLIIAAGLACMTFLSASAAISKDDKAWLTTRPDEKGSACDQGYREPPFFNTDKAPIPASLKKKTLFGNTFISKGYPLYILETQDERSCILIPMPYGLASGWVDTSLLKPTPVNTAPADWHGRWQANGTLSVADKSYLPEWAQSLAPRETQGSEGEFTISASTDGPAGTVQIVGEKTILSARTGEKFNDRFEGTGRILGPMLIFDEARSANRPMTTEDCLIVMLTDTPGRIQVNSYGRCADNAVHNDGPYRQAPIAVKAN